MRYGIDSKNRSELLVASVSDLLPGKLSSQVSDAVPPALLSHPAWSSSDETSRTHSDRHSGIASSRVSLLMTFTFTLSLALFKQPLKS